ncbi:SCO family protein [Mucilaginibacter glaciei]|uniref:SCO family protein n=1 Tax=Mucilaginibacter glaciei TaxID=2772109 RepID=A0A926NWC6_9SPHI|nr:SCO family protein [Mucilaginibacter glaciei]MBD1392929.1 SCO family protein [Mucilaginibacter glaciei]
MKPIKGKAIVLFFLVIVTVPLLAFTLMRWYENNVEALPYYKKGTSIEDPDSKHFTVPDFAFLNADSNLVKSDFVSGKVWVVNYFFTSCPSICPKMMAGMRFVQEAFPNDDQVRLVSLTVDPYHDSPAKLKSYAKKKNINLQQWQLATGSKSGLYLFARNGLFITATDGDGGDNDFIHSDKIVLIDREKHIRGYYTGTDNDEINRLIKDISRLKLMPKNKSNTPL